MAFPRLFEIHEQQWFPQFLRDQFVDELQMILEVRNTWEPIAHLLRKRLEECGSDRVADLCSGAGGPWPSLVRHFEMQGGTAPEVFLTDKYPDTENFMTWNLRSRIAFTFSNTRSTRRGSRETSTASGRYFRRS